MAQGDQVVVAAGQQSQHRAVIITTHQAQPAVTQPRDRGRQRVVAVVLGRLGRSEQTHSCRQRGRHIDDVLTRGEQLLGQQLAQPIGGLHRPHALVSQRRCPRQQPLRLRAIRCDLKTRDLSRQRTRWLTQLDSYGGRDLPAARRISDWLEAHRPADQPSTLCHGDYKLDNLLFAVDAPPRLLAVVDWEMAAIGDPLVDLAWALVFHPGPEGTIPLGMAKEPRFDVAYLPDRASLVERYATRSGRSTATIGWYDVFARWKLAIVLEGSYAKFLHGRSDKPIHQYFGAQVDLLLDSGTALIDQEKAS